MNRITVKWSKPNPLFEVWLEEWMNEAASKNSDLRHHFSKALGSLKKYPLPLKSGRDCIILQNFGEKLCSMLDRKLEERKPKNNVAIADDHVRANCKSNERDECAKDVENGAVIKEGGQEISKKKRNVKTGAANKARAGKEDEIETAERDIRLNSNEFDIILLVDTQETCGAKTKPQHDAAISELTQLGVLFEVRHLKVGDFAWIARCRYTNTELVLPYIVERKRIDDLCASITDGRFHEQKFRLKQCGIENLMYIVEEHGKNHRLAIPYSSLMQASVNSIVQDGFSLKYTESHKDSMFYLSSLTRILNEIYQGKKLLGCKKHNLGRTDILSGSIELMEFKEFNSAAAKQKAFKVREMFVRQLLQLKGMSVDKALAIVDHYPSPKALFNAFSRSEGNEDLLLANIQFGDPKRFVGPAISRTVHQLYTKTLL